MKFFDEKLYTRKHCTKFYKDISIKSKEILILLKVTHPDAIVRETADEGTQNAAEGEEGEGSREIGQKKNREKRTITGKNGKKTFNSITSLETWITCSKI